MEREVQRLVNRMRETADEQDLDSDAKIDLRQGANTIEDLALKLANAERAAEYIEQAIARDGRATRGGIWTDRDCMVHVLAILIDSDRGRLAAINAPTQIVLPRLALETAAWPTTQVRYSRMDDAAKTMVRITKNVFAEVGMEEVPRMIQVAIEEDN